MSELGPIPLIPQLDRVNIQVFICPLPTTFSAAEPQLGKAVEQIKALGGTPERAVFSERLMRESFLELIVRRDDGITFDLHEEITPGDALLIYAKNSRIISLVVVARDFVDMLTESRVVAVSESREQKRLL